MLIGLLQWVIHRLTKINVSNEDNKKRKIACECLVVKEVQVLINIKTFSTTVQHVTRITLSFHQQSANML